MTNAAFINFLSAFRGVLTYSIAFYFAITHCNHSSAYLLSAVGTDYFDGSANTDQNAKFLSDIWLIFV